MAIRLKQEGIDDFTVLERGDDVGGTWHFNTYPGCACDVPSHLYSFSFAPNPEWSETYSRQPEIRDYLHRVADEYGVRPHVRLNCAVEGIEWEDGGWTVATSDGPLRARVVVAGMGPLAEPKFPPVEGLDDFEGEMFHSARWNHDYDLTGKRVAAIGTGASAIQFVPEIQKQAAQVHVVQRTPPWVMPHPNREIRGWEKRLYDRVPALQKLVRGGIYAARELLVLGFVKHPRLMKLPERIARRHMASQISDPELLEKVTPDYTIGCKRILPSNRWYRALVPAQRRAAHRRRREGHAQLGRSPATARSARSTRSSSAPASRSPTCRSAGWCAGRAARRSTTSGRAARRPTSARRCRASRTCSCCSGPNTGLGHSSMVYMIESQVAYVLDALRYMDRHGADTVEVRADAAERYNADIDERMQGTVWNTGCASWYLDDTGPQRDAVARLDVALPPADRARSTPPTSSSRRGAPPTPSR